MTESWFSWFSMCFGQAEAKPAHGQRWLSTSSLSPSELDSTISTPLSPSRPPHQPLPQGLASPYTANASAAFRLLEQAQELSKLSRDDKLSAAMREEAIEAATFIMNPNPARVVPARQPPADIHVAHPFIRVCPTSRETDFITTPLPLYVFSEVEFPPSARIEIDSLISIWLPGRAGSRIMGAVRNMQPTHDKRTLFHLVGADGRLVGYLVGPSHTAFAPDREAQAAEYAARRELERLRTAPTLPLPQHSVDLFSIDSVGNLLAKLEGAQRPLSARKRARSGASVDPPPHPPPNSPLPATPSPTHALSIASDADSTVSTLSHPPTP